MVNCNDLDVAMLRNFVRSTGFESITIPKDELEGKLKPVIATVTLNDNDTVTVDFKEGY